MSGEDKMRAPHSNFPSGGMSGIESVQGRNPASLQPNEVTLYVGNLSPRIDEQSLFNLFKDFQISGCRIMRDTYTAESRRFAFVTFFSIDVAEKARNALNYRILDNFEIRICFKRNVSELKQNANVFVKSLSLETTAKELDQAGQPFGKVVSCIVRIDDNGRSLGYGYIQYEEEANAKVAIEKLNGSTLNGSVINVSQFVPSKNRPVNKNNIFLKQFPEELDQATVEKEINNFYSKFGTITSMGVFPHNNPATNTPSFYAFIAFSEDGPADKAIEASNGKDFLKLIKGEPADLEDPAKGLYVAFVMSKRVRKAKMKKQAGGISSVTNLFIKSLKSSVTETDLKQVFSKWGDVTSVCIKEGKSYPHQPPFHMGFQQTQPTGTVRFGFINFARHEDAEKALFEGKKDADVLAVVQVEGRKAKEFLYFHQPKAVREAYLRMKQQMNPNYMFKNQRIPFFQQFPVAPNFNVPLPAHNSTPGTTSRQSEREQPHTVEWLKKNKKEFTELSKDKQNQILGNLMYSRVQESKLASTNQIPKVTGMLIDLDILDYAEVIDILENDAALKERINEALEILAESPA